MGKGGMARWLDPSLMDPKRWKQQPNRLGRKLPGAWVALVVCRQPSPASEKEIDPHFHFAR